MVSLRFIELRLRSWSVLAYRTPRFYFKMGLVFTAEFLATSLAIENHVIARNTFDLGLANVFAAMTAITFITSLLLSKKYLREGNTSDRK